MRAMMRKRNIRAGVTLRERCAGASIKRTGCAGLVAEMSSLDRVRGAKERRTGREKELTRRAGDAIWRPSLGPVGRDLE